VPIPFPSLPFCPAPRVPETPTPPPSSTPVTLCSPWAAAVRLPLATTTPWEASPHLTDTPRPFFAAGPPPEPPRRSSLPPPTLRSAVGIPPPVVPFPSQDLQKVRLELLELTGHSFSTPDTTPRQNLAGDVPVSSSPQASSRAPIHPPKNSHRPCLPLDPPSPNFVLSSAGIEGIPCRHCRR
jgi:hypothetical protein